ncbi:hypothetical protein K438DRAFT_1628649 [Mycena galopus ATCC 62051]|nr:hypothetical protein K438DRAFT_1628649 [Mycena galopus ATCC 62051]
MPNPLQELTGSDDLYVIMLPMWADNVSGNKSKQYNKHMNMYRWRTPIYQVSFYSRSIFVRFVSTSSHVGSPEQFSAIKKQIQAMHTDPIRCHNAAT